MKWSGSGKCWWRARLGVCYFGDGEIDLISTRWFRVCSDVPPMSPRVVCVCHVGCVGVGRSVTSGNYFAGWRALERYVCVRV